MTRSAWYLDARSKFVFLLAANIVAFAHAPAPDLIMGLSLIGLALTIGCRMKKLSLACASLLILALLMQLGTWQQTPILSVLTAALPTGTFSAGFWQFTGTIGFFLQRYLIVACLIAWFFKTSTSAQILAAAQKSRLPFGVYLPLAVMFRFLPTVKTEIVAIRQTLALRSILPNWYSVFLFPHQAAKYLLVPLISTSLRSGDQLAQAAMVRGLGAPIKRTSIVSARLQAVDWLVIAGSIALVLRLFWI